MPTTEDPSPISRASLYLIVEGENIGVGTLLVLQPGDYFFDDDWFDPAALCLRVSLIGQMANLEGDWFRYIEGEQIARDGRTRARAICVRNDALPAAVRAGKAMDAKRSNSPRPPMIYLRADRNT